MGRLNGNAKRSNGKRERRNYNSSYRAQRNHYAVAEDDGNRNNNHRKSRSVSQQGKSKKIIRRKDQKNKDQRYRNRRRVLSLQPVHGVSRHSIHAGWKQKLGGLIRWYINTIGDDANVDVAMKEIEEAYISSGCSIEGTKEAILQAISRKTSIGAAKIKEEETCDNMSLQTSNWIELYMVIENTDDDDDKGEQYRNTYTPSTDGKGLRLNTEQRQGEGPAHMHEIWSVVRVPSWAEGKPYYFEVVNKSNLDLSCEMEIDDVKVARNAPIPAKNKIGFAEGIGGSCSTIKPNNDRYFLPHSWVLQTAQRIKLHELQQQQQQKQQQQPQPQQERAESSYRYNGIRPTYNEKKRISYIDFPDPTSYGWEFTGSNEKSCLEFYRKNVNIGHVLMDFYFTSGTVKTVLNHPTTGMNQLFRRCKVSPAIFKQILANPRQHTGIGYRTRGLHTGIGERRQQNRPYGNDNDEAMVDAEEVEPTTAATTNDNSTNKNFSTSVGMDLTDGANSGADAVTPNSTYPAKNDKYDFQKEGHVNRDREIKELQSINEFQSWEKAQQKENAWVHAKFYVSMKGKKTNSNSNRGRRGPTRHYNGRGRKTRPKEDLPEMAKVIDVKSAEKALLTTKFQPTGGMPSALTSNHSNRPKTSKIFMKRVAGLTDNVSEGASEPVFEFKLYYRAENVLELPPAEGIDMASESMDEEDDGTATMPFAETNLTDYKIEKHEQLKNVHEGSGASDENEAEEMFKNCWSHIESAQDIQTVDKVMKVYWDWNQRQRWLTGTLENHQGNT